MKKYKLIPLVTISLVLATLAFGLKTEESFFSGPHEISRQVTSPKMSQEILRKDFEEIKNILITNHPAPYQFTGIETFIKFYNEQLMKIDRPMNLGEYFLIAAPLVESLRCGHTWISLPAS